MLSFNSCMNDVSPNDDDSLVEVTPLTVKEGRLLFPDRSTFKFTYDENDESDGEIVRKMLPDLAQNGFFSHRPVFLQGDEELVKLYADRLHVTGGRLNSDEVDESIIADDNYAVFLNEKLEIHVGDSIYKYTEDGMYFVHENDIEHLYDYLANKPPGSGGRLAPCEEEIAPIDEKINLYTVEDDCGGGSPGGGSPGGGSTLPPPPPSLPSFLSTLDVCDARNGTWSWIFGASKVCEDFYDDKNKIKTKFWNQSYFFIESIGLSVKSRKKTLGIWFNQKIDEVGYGISTANFTYDLPNPDHSFLETSYIFKGTKYDKNGLPKGTAVPAWPFKSPLEIYIPLPIKNLDLKYTPEELNKMFWEQIWDQTKSVLKNLDQDTPTNVTLIAADKNYVYAVYVNIEEKETNVATINNVFDWNGQISFKFSAKSGYSPEFKSVGKIYDYKDVRVEFYGYGKESGQYRGSKMIFTD